MVDWEIVVIGKAYSELNGQGKFKELVGRIVEYVFSVDKVQEAIGDELFNEANISIVFPQRKIYVEFKPMIEKKEDE